MGHRLDIPRILDIGPPASYGGMDTAKLLEASVAILLEEQGLEDTFRWFQKVMGPVVQAVQEDVFGEHGQLDLFVKV